MINIIAAARKTEIKNLLLQNKSVNVLDLSVLFNVTVETIRRDLKALENEGIAERTHGGAILTNKVSTSFTRQTMKNILKSNKDDIAKVAHTFIKNGMCLYIDSSTTAQYILPKLRDIQLTIVTNSVDVISVLSNYENINLIALGGTYNYKYRNFVGSTTLNSIKNLFFDLAVISCRTISIEHGLTDSDEEETEIKRIALSHAKKSMALIDYTKFDKVSLVKICDVKDIDILVTDNKLSYPWIEAFEKNDVSYFVANK